MLVLRYVFDFVRLLHSETSPRQLCMGVVLGMFMGFTPASTLHWGMYFIIMLLLRVNMGSALLGFAVFGMLSFALDPMFSSLGLWALTQIAELKPLWVSWYHAPIIPFTRYNNSIVMGSFLMAVALSIPVFFASKILVLKYRTVVVARVKQSHFARAVMASKVYKLYAKYTEYTF